MITNIFTTLLLQRWLLSLWVNWCRKLIAVWCQRIMKEGVDTYQKSGAFIPRKPMMHIAYCPYFHKIYKFSPYFCKIYKFPSISTKFINFPPISAKFIKSPYFRSIYGFLLIYAFAKFRFFCFPLFDHDAFMHHALHVLDTSNTS